MNVDAQMMQAPIVLVPVKDSRRAALRTIVAFAAVSQGIGFCGQGMSPVLIAGLQQGWALSPAMAGVVETIELIATALFAAWLSSLTIKASPRKLALVGVGIAAACQVLSSFAGGVAALIVLRLIVGLGAAACVYAGNVVLSANREPDKLYGHSSAISAIAFTAFVPVLVYFSTLTGGRGAFATVGIWMLVLVPFILLLPMTTAPTLQKVDADKATGAFSPKMLLVTVPIFLFTVFSTGLWAFAGNVATSSGVTPTLFGLSISVGTAISVIFAWAAALMGTRFGRLFPLGLGIAIMTLSSIVFLVVKEPAPFVISFVLLQGMNTFMLPFIFGLCSAIDRTGKLATAGSSALLVAAAISPAMTGWLIEVAGYIFLCFALATSYAISFLAFYSSSKFLRTNLRDER